MHSFLDVSAPATPTVQVLNDPPSVGQACHPSQALNPVAVDPSELPSPACFCFPAMIALNIRFVLRLFSGRRRDQDFQHEFESLLRSKRVFWVTF